MVRNRGARELVYVEIPVGAEIMKYTFPSALADSLRNNLGQTKVISTVNITNLAVSPSSPKPATASRLTATGYEGSYASTNKIKELRSNRYRIKRARASKLRAGRNARSYYATINGLRIASVSNAFNDPLATDAGFPGAFGLTEAEANDVGTLVYFPDFPKLAVVRFTSTKGSFSSVCAPNKVADLLAKVDAPDNGLFTEVRPGLHTKAQFLQIFSIGET